MVFEIINESLPGFRSQRGTDDNFESIAEFEM